MSEDRHLVVVGSGWLGSAVAAANPDCTHVSQRSFDPAVVPQGAAIIVASGWSSLSADDPESKVQSELDDVGRLLDTARRRDSRIVVVGSSDVCGLAEVVTGMTPVGPVTRYGELKARREALVVEVASDGVDAVAVRLAPTHGPGKAQSARLVSLASKPVIPLPRGGRYPVGFVTLADASEALSSLTSVETRPVVSVGAGRTELAALIDAIGAEVGNRPRAVPVPLPIGLARRMSSSRVGRLAWLGRFASPRTVEMEVAVTPMSLQSSGQYLAKGNLS